jgi:hypothetical protein
METSYPSGRCEHCGRKRNEKHHTTIRTGTEYGSPTTKMTGEYPRMNQPKQRVNQQHRNTGTSLSNLSNVDWKKFTSDAEKGRLDKEQVKVLNVILTIVMIFSFIIFPPIGIVIAVVRGQIIKNLKRNG